jgi:hypothetical protein
MLVSFHLEIVLIFTQDRGTVCTKRTIGSKLFRTHLMVLLGDQGQVDARFIPLGDSANLYLR